MYIYDFVMNSKPRRLICCIMSVKAFIWNWMPAVINAAFPCSNCGLFVLVMAEHWIWQKLSGSKEPSGENCSLSLTHCCGKKFAKNGHGAPLAADALFLARLLRSVSCTLALFFFLQICTCSANFENEGEEWRQSVKKMHYWGSSSALKNVLVWMV